MSVQSPGNTWKILEIITYQIIQAEMLIKTAQMDLSTLKPTFQVMGIMPKLTVQEAIDLTHQTQTKLSQIRSQLDALKIFSQPNQEDPE